MNQMTDMKTNLALSSTQQELVASGNVFSESKPSLKQTFFLENCVFKFSRGCYNFDMVYTLLHQISWCLQMKCAF